MILGLGALALDTQVDRGVASGVLYVGVVAMTAGIPGWRVTVAVAALAALLTALGYFLSPGAIALWKAGANRGLAILAIVATAALVLHHKRLTQRLVQAARRAERSERQLGAAFESMPVGLLLLDVNGRILLANLAAARLFGYGRRELMGKPVDLLLPAAASQLHAFDQAALPGSGQARSNGCGESITGIDKLGRTLALDLGLTPIDTPDGTCLMATVVDRADRLLAEQMRGAQEATRRVIEAEENQRKRMAREIHDALGQPLTALKLDIEWLARRLGASAPELHARVAEMQALAAGTIEEVRRLSAELRPAILDDHGLPAAVRWQVDDFERRAGVSCTLTLHEDVDWCADGCTVAYRVLQEALTNVTRHAGASRVGVALHRDAEGHGVLEVSDDGCGFDAAMPARAGALGLLGMRERAALQGGSLDVRSRPGGGTTVSLRMPCEPEVAA